MSLIQLAKLIKDEDALTILQHPEDFDGLMVLNAINRIYESLPNYIIIKDKICNLNISKLGENWVVSYVGSYHVESKLLHDAIMEMLLYIEGIDEK